MTMINELAEAANIAFLTGENASFHATEGRMLSVTTGETEHPAVYIHSSFPHTNRHAYLSIRTIDNKEIGIIRSLDDFDSETAKLLEQHVQMRYFAPEITRIVKVKEEFGYSYWETETTSGICRFTVRGGGNNVKMVTPIRMLITDVDGNRFVVPDYSALSDKEYRMVEMFM